MKNKTRSELSLWAGGVLKRSRYAAWEHLDWSKSGPNLISDHMSTASTQQISYTPCRLFIFVKLDDFSAHLAWMRQLLWLKTLKNAVLFSQWRSAINWNVAIWLCQQMIRGMVAFLVFKLRRPVTRKTTYTNKVMRKPVKKLWVPSAQQALDTSAADCCREMSAS